MIIPLDSDKVKTFEEHTKVINNQVKLAMLEYLTGFKVKDPIELGLLFSLLEKDTGSVCAKNMEMVGGWRCYDCIKNENTIFCQKCWETMKEKHKDHNICYLTAVNGTCDCGDINQIDKKYFCTKHKGPLTNDEEVNAYVKSCLREDLITLLRRINRNVIKEMAKYIVAAFQEKKTDTAGFKDTVVYFIDFLSFPCTVSKICLHIIAPLLLENYPFKTKHVCLNLGINENDNNIKLVTSTLFSHDCTCPFIRLLMSVWPVGHVKLLYSFLHNYKLRKAMGYFYLLLYEHIAKDFNDDLQEMAVQIIFDEVCRNACKVDGLIEYMYSGIPDIIQIFNKYKDFTDNPDKIELLFLLNELTFKNLQGKKYGLLMKLISKLKYDSYYLLKSYCMKELGSREKIYMYLIDCLALIQNVNSVKVIVPNPKNIVRDAYKIELKVIESDLLDIFSLYVSILHFDDENLVKSIFTYFSKKIYKKSYLVLDKDDYSFHIPLFRGFSVLLNRYCFYYANKNKTDIFSGLNYAIKLIPNHQEIFKIIIKDIYKVFGFVTACGENFFTYYGQLMSFYENDYFSNKGFIYLDFSLMKYLFALKENEKYLAFNKILQLSQVENSNALFEDNFFNSEKLISPDKWLTVENKKYVKFSAKILRIILNILRNNTCLIWNLGSNYSQFIDNKVEDTLVKSIINTDRENFVELTKELIINKIMTQQNLSSYTDIYDSIYVCVKECLGKDFIKNLILSLTNKTLTQEKKAKFSVKNEFLKLLDINYISFPRDQSSVEKYITDFKKNQISIFNIHFYPSNVFEVKLTKQCYKQIFFYEDNFDFIFRFTAFLLKRKEFFSLQEFMLNVLLNFLATFFCSDDSAFIFFRETINNQIMQLIDILENNELKDEMQKSYCHFIVEKIAENDKIYTISKNEVITSDNNNNKINSPEDLNNTNKISEKNVPPPSNKKLSMKEKMKNKFKKKNDNLGNKYGLKNIEVKEKKDKEACIYCLKPIEDDDITKPYGKIGDFLCDNYLSNAFFQVIRKEYKKYYDINLKLPSFDLMYYQPENRKNIRVISCNHKIHFSCHFEAFMKSDLRNSINVFQCPLCSKISETYIPSLDSYTKEQTFGVFLGYDVEYVMKLGEKKTDYYNNIEKKLDEKSNKILDKEKSEKSDIKDEIDLFQIVKQAEEEEKKKKENENDEILNDKTLKISIKDFKNNYGDLINSCKHYIEGFFGMKLRVDSVNLEDDIFKSLMKPFLVFCSIQYRDFLDFFENTSDKKTIVDLWKNLSLSLRLLIKLNIIDSGFFFTAFYKLINNLKDYTFDLDLEVFIKYDSMRLTLSEFLFFIVLFFDYNEIEGYEKYILYFTLPAFGFEFFYREIYINNSFEFNKAKFTEIMNEEEFYKYLNGGISKNLNLIVRHIVEQLFITKILIKNEQQLHYEYISLELNTMLDDLNLSELKNKTFIQILDYLEKSIMNNETENKFFEYLKPTKTYKEIFTKIILKHQEAIQTEKCDKLLNPSLFGTCLPIIYNFINLPKTAVEFEYNVYNLPCECCEKTGKNSLVCLDCGKKVCDSRKCMTKVKKAGDLPEPGFIAHCRKCGGGRSAFLQTIDCSVLFVSNRAVFKKFIPLYVNEFGEGITKRSFGEEFVLSEEEVNNALKMFTNYSYSNAPIIT